MSKTITIFKTRDDYSLKELYGEKKAKAILDEFVKRYGILPRLKLKLKE